MLNPNAEQFFLSRSARDEVGMALLDALKPLGEYKVFGQLQGYKAPYAVTADTVFCGASGMADTWWRLRIKDYEIALASGAKPTEIGPEWVRIELYRPDWPQPDLAHWALRAYDFARLGS
jgi:hypothetical protein